MHIQVRQNVRQGIGQAAGFEDGVKRAARADNQQNVGDGAKAMLGMGQHRTHPHMLAQPQQVIGDEHGDEHGGDRVTDKFQQRIQRAFSCHIQLGEGLHQHQADGQQHGKQRGSQRGQRVFFTNVEVRKFSRDGFEGQAIAQQFQEQRAANQ